MTNISADGAQIASTSSETIGDEKNSKTVRNTGRLLAFVNTKPVDADATTLLEEGGPAVPRDEETALWIRLPLSLIFLENGRQRVWNRKGRLARFAFRGLNLDVPRGATHVQEFAVEINVSPPQAEHFAGA